MPESEPGYTDPILTIVLPTRNEAGNIAPLLARLGPLAADYRLELLFVDDSDDATPAEVADLTPQQPFPVRLLHRPEAQRNGLSGAVVAGLRAARGSWVCVMDADLQHPPEVVAALLQRAAETEADVVVASRQGGLTGPIGLSRNRALTSQGLTILARGLFPNLLRNVSDPLTGFFLARRDRIDPARLRPDGFKILLEILIRHPDLRVSELHFAFGRRHAGESKADLQEGIRFFRHLLRLRLTANPLLNLTLLVGLAGLALNTWLLAWLLNRSAAHYLWSAWVAGEAMFLWQEVAREGWILRRQPGQRGSRLRRSLVAGQFYLLVRLPLIWILSDGLTLPVVWSNLITIILVAAWRYLFSDRWIWTRRSIPPPPDYFHYDIHGLVTIESTARLPSLAYFRARRDLGRPDIRLIVDRYGTPRCAAGSICYDEGLGRFGFAVAINPGETTEVLVSAFLGRSPHVLYTSILEPLLRWALVRRGLVLIHGACVARAEAAVLIVDPGRQGKSRVALELVRQGWRFLADDMTILDPGGLAWSFPKPFIVNQAILWAESARDLAPGQRLWRQIQSRLYSRLAYWGGLLLYRLHLPAATLNALAQRLLPPRLRHLVELVPGGKIVDQARLEAIIQIARGPDGESSLAPTAIQALLATSVESKFVFPPYPELADALSQWRGQALRPVEEQLIAKVSARLPGWQLVRSADDWSQWLQATPAGPLAAPVPDGS